MTAADKLRKMRLSFSFLCKYNVAVKFTKFFLCLVAFFSVTSCSYSRNLVITCQERYIEIYVNGQYLGRDMVYYTVPKGQNYVEISCRDNGNEVYLKKIYTDDLNKENMIELQIPKNLRYSNNRQY